MKLAIMQPYFLPYIGYFQLINAVDKFVIYDDVNYIKRGWVNRNNILLNGKSFQINLLVTGASQNKKINTIEISSNQKKLIKTIENVYKKAPFYCEVFPLFQKIMDFNDHNLGKFLSNSIFELCNYIDINTEIIIASSINKNNNLKGQDKIIHICELLGTDYYLNSVGGMTLYDKDEFKKK